MRHHRAETMTDSYGENEIPYLPLGFSDSSIGKESTYKAGDPSSIPRSGRSAEEGIGYLLQYS